MISNRNSTCTERVTRHRHPRRGQALVEFAVVGLVMYMLLAAILTFGHALYVAQGLQTAADLGAREISRTPLPVLKDSGEFTFEDALEDSEVRRRIFDEAWLVIDLDEFYLTSPGGNVFQDIVPLMPVLNQQLVTMMIVDRPTLTVPGPDPGDPPETRTLWLLRYPGALLHRDPAFNAPLDEDGNPTSYPAYVATDFTVGIPVVESRAVDGVETIRWVDVVEEIDTEEAPEDDTAPNPDPFSITSPQRGLVALRINFPFQSASMSSFRHDEGHPEFPFEPTIGRPNAADDDGVLPFPAQPPDGTSLTDSQLTRTVQDPNDPTQEIVLYTGTYGGRYGLGAQGALGSPALTGGGPVRPYRRIISAQAIYRREVFEN